NAFSQFPQDRCRQFCGLCRPISATHCKSNTNHYSDRDTPNAPDPGPIFESIGLHLLKLESGTLTVYPNPGRGIFYLRYPPSPDGRTYPISVYDNYGRLVYSGRTTTIDLSQLATTLS